MLSLLFLVAGCLIFIASVFTALTAAVAWDTPNPDLYIWFGRLISPPASLALALFSYEVLSNVH